MVLLMLTNEMKNLAKYSIKTFCTPRNLCNFTKFKRVRSSFHLPILNTSSRGYSGINGSLLDVREEVRAALNEDKAVVALESAIITHGMPSPANYETALLLEDILRKMGCVPATIGVVKGRLVVGINHEELQVLADPKQSSDKVTTRGLPLTLAKGRYGGTTVAASLTACRLAGIEVFTTGGLGGVHRPPKIGGVTWDVSADLVELGRSPGIAVVCAGVKSILDVPATLEYLETQGVTVTVLTDGPASSSVQFPDFFSRESGVLAPATVQDTEEAAHVLLAAKEIGTPGAVVVAVPTPAEYALAGNQIKEAIVESLREAERLGVRGCAVTPSVLAKLAALTGGTSVSANIGLISNNVKRGGELALSLTKIKHQNNSRRISSAVPHLPPSPPYKQQEQMSARSAGGDHPVVVVGGCVVDFVATITEPQIELNGRTHLGNVRQSYGGVGRNVADALAHMCVNPLFVSAVGDDAHAQPLLTHNPALTPLGVVRTGGALTSTYCALLDCGGEALLGVGDMEVHAAITPDWVDCFSSTIQSARLVVCDGNIPQATMDHVLTLSGKARVPVWFEPTDVQKSCKPWCDPNCGRHVTFASPNLNELRTMCASFDLGTIPNSPKTSLELDRLLEIIVKTVGPMLAPFPFSSPCPQQSDASQTLPQLRALMVSLGPHGFMMVRHCPPTSEDTALMPLIPCSKTATSISRPVGMFFPPPQYDNIVSVSGAGDCLASGFIAAMLAGQTVSECAAVSNTAASLSLQALPTVPATLSSVRMEDVQPLPYTLVY